MRTSIVGNCRSTPDHRRIDTGRSVPTIADKLRRPVSDERPVTLPPSFIAVPRSPTRGTGSPAALKITRLHIQFLRARPEVGRGQPTAPRRRKPSVHNGDLRPGPSTDRSFANPQRADIAPDGHRNCKAPRAAFLDALASVAHHHLERT